MTFLLNISPTAKTQLFELKNKSAHKKRFNAVSKALKYLQTNPKHPSLNIHLFQSKQGPNGEKIWEAYAENNTPGAYRIFFYYGPEKRMISIVMIVPHPD